ncbi:MAG TPA: hypothetical protein VMV90_15325 [Rectinemataceae bacterium]|nr:hypothetical protein [Rectinemataceae bacterium]
MDEDKERDLDKRVEDLRAIRAMLAEGSDVPLIYPWAFFAWAVLVAAGAAAHYALYLRLALGARDALLWLWLPLVIVGAIVEGISFALKASKGSVPLFNRRLGGAMLSGFAMLVILTVVVVRLSLSGSLSPGLGLLIASLPIIIYAQISYVSLYFETFVGIAVGLLLEFAGARGPLLLFAAAEFAALLYAACGFHIAAIERRRRG